MGLKSSYLNAAITWVQKNDSDFQSHFFYDENFDIFTRNILLLSFSNGNPLSVETAFFVSPFVGMCAEVVALCLC